MRVLIVQHGIFPGFVAPIAKECAKHLWRLGVQVEVVTIGKRMQQGTSESLEFPAQGVEASSLRRVYAELRPFVDRSDLVHYFPGKGLELLPFLNRRVKYIFNHISVSVTGDPRRDRLVDLGKRLQPVFADLVLFTDEALANALWPIGRKRVRLMPVGYAEDLFYPCPPYQPQGEKQLVYHGAVRPQRGLDQLVGVLARLPSEYTLTIIGGGLAADEAYRQDLAVLARCLKCADRLNLVNMPQAQIRTVLDKAYLGLSYVPMLECYQEQFVLKTLEFLACQRPVLASATRYTRRFSNAIGPGRLLLSDGTAEDMVNKILDADDYVRNFYVPENLNALPIILAPYASKHLVETRLLPIYQELLS